LDFAGRKVIEEIPDVSSLKIENILKNDLEVEKYLSSVQDYSIHDESSVGRPIYKPTGKWEVGPPSGLSSRITRVQDPELQQMRDDGKCLSVQQPYASLIVAGIKFHEGRSWYSAHRGRLWIASSGRAIQIKEQKEIESAYRILRGDSTIFPPLYPTGCLLGCVDVVDCLSQEEYRDYHPEGECTDPYVFIFANPRALVVKFPIQGKAKIFDLDDRICAAAQKALEAF